MEFEAKRLVQICMMLVHYMKTLKENEYLIKDYLLYVIFTF